MIESIPSDWKAVLAQNLANNSFGDLQNFVEEEYATHQVFPPKEYLFEALRRTPFERVKVVILGQDPYSNTNQAHGLAFSVRSGVKIPPSLRNIYKELACEFATDLSMCSGDLSRWADQGVLLLNTILTVRERAPLSHQKKGWEEFTDALLCALNEKREHLIFMLWGAPAQKKRRLLSQTKHLILEASHPSPLSAHRGFLGCNHFKTANTDLIAHHQTPIAWF